MVKALIKGSGVTLGAISEDSERAAKAYKPLCPDLPARLSTATISRMATGSALKALKKGNLRLLHLTVHYLQCGKREAAAVSPKAAEAATSFAKTVLAAGTAPRGAVTSFYNPNDPRHDRTADLFGEYGIGLIECAIAQEDGPTFRKLAILQWLSGNTDDARYWNQRAHEAGQGSPEDLDAGIAAQEAFAAGRWYLYSERRAVAEIYFTLAADAGHADAAFLLGDMLEMTQQNADALRWFYVAKSNGHSEAGKRLSALKSQGNERAVWR
ncbi:hypothetical protein ABZ914_04935 [Spirillospora sp. NPDC046719]